MIDDQGEFLVRRIFSPELDEEEPELHLDITPIPWLEGAPPVEMTIRIARMSEAVSDLNRAFVVAFTPVVESFAAFARRLHDLGLVDAFVALASVDRLPLDDHPEGCWADVWDDETEDYLPCDAGHVDELGLCPDHAARLREIGG